MEQTECLLTMLAITPSLLLMSEGNLMLFGGLCMHKHFPYAKFYWPNSWAEVVI